MKKIISAIAALAVSAGVGTSAMAFTDMPEGDMGAALQRAVDVGLMNGVTDDEIAPYANITRAQMATILVRAFGAENYENPSQDASAAFADVSSGAWYADMVKRASAIGAFQGDDDNNFNPENNITFQETYIVLSRMFGFEPYEVRYASKPSIMLEDVDDSVLNAFSDASQIADWARDDAKYIVGNGGWTGIDGKLKPTDYITRGEFAILMNAIVTNYVDKPGTYKDLADGLTLVRSGGVTIDGLTTDSNLIFTYAVDETGAKATNSTVNGVTLVLGGIDKTPKENSQGKLMPDESYITIEGTYYDVRNITPYVFLNGSNASIGFYKGIENSLVSLSFNG